MCVSVWMSQMGKSARAYVGWDVKLYFFSSFFRPQYDAIELTATYYYCKPIKVKIRIQLNDFFCDHMLSI